MTPFDVVQAQLFALPRAEALHAELRRGYVADKDDLRPRGWLALIVVAGTKRLQDYYGLRSETALVAAVARAVAAATPSCAQLYLKTPQKLLRWWSFDCVACTVGEATQLANQMLAVARSARIELDVAQSIVHDELPQRLVLEPPQVSIVVSAMLHEDRTWDEVLVRVDRAALEAHDTGDTP